MCVCTLFAVVFCFLLQIPWRKSNVKYVTNEIYFDIEEHLDALLSATESRVTAQVWRCVYICVCGCWEGEREGEGERERETERETETETDRQREIQRQRQRQRYGRLRLTQRLIENVTETERQR